MTKKTLCGIPCDDNIEELLAILRINGNGDEKDKCKWEKICKEFSQLKPKEQICDSKIIETCKQRVRNKEYLTAILSEREFYKKAELSYNVKIVER
ncbi:MAG: hypothetical protein V1815_01320 [Candidatus Woesearchaeota archaeon]